MTQPPQYPSYPGPDQPATPPSGGEVQPLPPPGYQPPPPPGYQPPPQRPYGTTPQGSQWGVYASWWSRVGAQLLDVLIAMLLPIIPLICGHVDKQIAECIGKILLQFFGPSTLWVISSDFTHFGYSFGYVPFKTDVPENLRKLDLGAVEKISALDFDGFSKYVESTGATICGANPIRILLKTANLAAAKGAELKASLIEYTTSGESTGDWSHCVSYAGIAVYRR